MKIKRPICVMSILFVFVVYLVLSILGGVDSKEYFRDFEQVSGVGIVKDKVIKNEKHSVHVVCERLESKSHIKNYSDKRCLILYLKNQDSQSFKIGQRIEFCGKYNNFAIPENEGQFDVRRFYRIRRYEASVNKCEVYRASSSYSLYKEFLFGIKSSTKALFFSKMEDENAGTLSAMVLGDKSDLEEEIKQLYQGAGIAHVLSLSGLHIATVGMCLYTLLLKGGCGVRLSSIVAGFIMISYGIMTGLSTSTIRALVMFFMTIFAKSIGRTYDLLTGLSLSAVFILIENPYYIYDSGFQMSVASVCGIGTLYPIFDETTKYTEKCLWQFVERVFGKTRQGICVSLAAILSTLPIQINTFYEVSRYGALVNIIVVPLMGIILFLAIISVIVWHTLGGLRLFRYISEIGLKLTEKLLVLYTYISKGVVSTRGNTWVIGRSSVMQTVVYIILLVALYIYFEYIRNNNKPGRSLPYNYKKKNYEKWYKSYSVRALLVALYIGLSVFIITFRVRPEFRIDVVSVGQGACNVISGSKTPTILVDCGSTDVKDLYKYRIKPLLLYKGINTIDYAFITHGDADHVNGITDLLKDEHSEIRIKKIIMPVLDDNLKTLAEGTKTKCYEMRKGDKIKATDVAITCLNPDANGLDDDINENSLVLKVTYNNTFSALFPGDISEKTEKKLSDVSADFLSVPHHGSKYSSCPEFLTASDSTICTISCGRGNSYGHPHDEALGRIKECLPEAKLFRTDTNGQIMITIDSGRAYANTFYATRKMPVSIDESGMEKK